MRRLEAFFHVASLGSFTRAASTLGMAQSALSRHVSALEQEFGERLFHRTGRGVVLTEFGRDILPRVESLLNEARRLREEVVARRDNVGGEIALGVLASLSPVLVTPVLTRIREQLPAVRVRVMDGLNDRIEDWLANGRVDIAVMYGERPVHRDTDELLFHADLYLIAAPGDPLVAKASIPLRRLGGLPMILPTLPNNQRVVVQRAFSENRVPLAVSLEFDYLPGIKELVARGKGYTTLPRHGVQRELEAGTLRASRIVDPIVSRRVLLTSSGRSPLSRAARETMHIIRMLTAQMLEEGDLLGRAASAPARRRSPWRTPE
ncbi:MAG: LysR family transcriptional regulator [Gemmatimonadales bacterium]|nr:LysR family transcriptional regulator [Gemmatimonadales bacterium]